MGIVLDGTVEFSAGVNKDLLADRLPRNQSAGALNGSFKRAAFSTRGGLHHILITITTKGSLFGISYQTIFDSGKFQGERKISFGKEEFLISVRAGLIFKIDLSNKTGEVLRTAVNDYISQNQDRVDITQANDNAVISDFPASPVIVFSSSARRANYYAKDTKGVAAPELPPSRLSTYVQNRTVVVNGIGEMLFSDPADYRNKLAHLTFQESLVAGFPYVGQSFNVGSGSAGRYVTAIGYLSSRAAQSRVQTSRYGPMFAATKDSVYLFPINLPRAEWTNSTFQTLEIEGIGMAGPRCHTIVNSDLLFVDQYGHVNSFSKSLNEERSGWATTCISRDVDPYLSAATEFQDKNFITYYNNLVFVGARCERIFIKGLDRQPIADYYHKGMCVMELDNVSGLSQNAVPAWAGPWTGIRPMEASVVNNSLYITSKDIDGYNRTYLYEPKKKYDLFNNKRVEIVSRLYTRAYDYEQPLLEKTESSIDLGLKRIGNTFNATLYRKPVHLSNYSLWGEQGFSEVCRSPLEGSSTNEGFKDFSFGNPKEPPLENTHRDMQLLIEFTGNVELTRIKVRADLQGSRDVSSGGCVKTPRNTPVNCCKIINDFDRYSICPKVT